ncbi:MAG: carbon monoxide dehydrogenase subunit G [Paracoccaceae bacterium]|jgi:carbon monoxide dehydrogenase subunit G
MEMTGEYNIPAPRQKVWEALNDPEILAACIPGCKELNKESDTELSATVKSKVGPVSATFKGKVTLSDIDAPNGYKISGEGTGGVAGFAKGGAEVKLVDDGDGTLLTYTATGQVGGKLAQIGSRLIDSTAKKMANEFFGKFAEVVGGSNAAPEASASAAAAAPAAAEPAATPAAAAPAPEAAPAAPATPAAAPAQSGGGISPVVWVGGLIVAVVVVLALLV